MHSGNEGSSRLSILELAEAALNSQLDTFFVFEPDSGKAVYWNKAFRSISGYTDSEIARLPAPVSYYDSDDLERMQNSMQENSAADVLDIEAHLVCKDGSRIHTEYRISYIADDQNKPKYIVSIGRDISERKQFEREQKKYEVLCAQSNDLAYICDLEGNILYINEVFETLSGHQSKEFIGKSFSPLFDEENLAIANENYLATLRGKSPKFEVAFRDTGIICEYKNKPYRDESGHIIGVFGIARDTTARKLAGERANSFNKILEESLNEIYIFDSESLKFIQVNYGARKNLGYSKNEIFSLTPIDIKPEFTKAAFIKLVEPLRTGGKEKIIFETIHQRKDGSLYPVEVHLQLSVLDSRKVFISIILDITERKQAEKRYSSLIKYTPTAVYTFDDAMHFIDTNPAGEKLLGYSRAELLSMNISQVDADPELVKPAHEQLNRGEPILNYEHRLVHKDGSIITVLNNSVPIKDIRGTVTNWNSFLMDVTERKKVEEEIFESEKKYHALFENMFNGFALHEIICNENGTPVDYIFLDINSAFEKMTGLTRSKVLGKRVTEVLPGIETDPADWIGHYGRVALLGEKANFEQYSESLKKWFAISAYSPAKGKFAVIAEDITERKQAEEALIESQMKFKLLADSTFEGIAIHENGILLEANHQFFCLFGYEPEELLGKQTISLCLTPESIPIVKENIANNIMEPYEIVGLRKDGSLFNGELHSSSGTYDGKQVRFTAIRDITKRKQAEESLRKLSSAIEQAGESIMITDRDGIIEYTNPAFTKLTGYTAEEVIGQTPGLLKSGNQDAVFYEDMWKTVTSGKVWHGKVIDRRKDGSFYPAMLTISPISDQSKNRELTHFVGIQSDLTQLQDIEHQFHQAQKMEAVGTLVGGIAHDFNNMLAGITGNLYLAKEEAKKLPHAVQYLDNIERVSFRAADMIQQLLTFARKDRVSIQQIPLNSFIRETLKLLRSSVPENIELYQNICSDDLQINGDGTQLHQVLLNLINNARDGVEAVEKPAITIRLEAWHPEKTFIDHHPNVKNQPYAHLSVEDNGIGIPEHQIAHLFEPFFTTKEQGKGTGLGLAMVFGAIETHHGFLEVESSEGKGSTFHIYIPLLVQAEGVVPTSAKKKVVRGHGEMILLVDDELEIIKARKALLESLGYRVLVAINGREAIDLFLQHSEEIDLCILDVVMPIMGGVEAAQVIRQIDPHAKIIFSTGYDKSLLDGMENETFLSKPFPIKEMSWLIREKLDS